MSQHAQIPGGAARAVGFPLRQLIDPHQHIAATLFAGFDHPAFKLVAFAVARMVVGKMAPERNKGGDAKFGQLLDQELGPIAFRQRGGDFERERQFTLRRFDREDFQRDFAPRNLRDARGILVAVAVEQADRVAGAESAHCGKMASFRAVQRERTGHKRQIDVKSFRHLW
jgi:hypothetical protein